jgi:hypothetical protein
MKCSIPVFEELLPSPHDHIILDLLFVLCTWHACAKLRLHTTSTMGFLKEMTRSLGFALRIFAKKTCSAFQTNELPKEEAARARRKAKAQSSTKKAQAGKSGKKSDAKQNRLKKVFNLFTYKLSALGDYLSSILRYGTTDSYSTQIVSFYLFKT